MSSKDKDISEKQVRKIVQDELNSAGTTRRSFGKAALLSAFGVGGTTGFFTGRTSDLGSSGDDTGRLVSNVTSFGAMGDGRADDTDAIQSAVNNAAEVGGSVFFPSGDYRITRYIDLKGTSAIGSGPSRSVIHVDPEISRERFVSGASSNDEWAIGAINENNWSVVGIGVNLQGQDAAGVANFNGENVNFVNCRALNSADCGFQWYGENGTETSPVRNCGIIGCNAEENRWNYVADGHIMDSIWVGNVSRSANASGFRGDPGEAANNSKIQGLVISGNTSFNDTCGVEFLRGDSALTITNNSIRSSVKTGMNLQNTNGVLTGNFIQNPRSVGLMLDRFFGTVQGNHIRNTGGEGVLTDRKCRLALIGNTFSSVGKSAIRVPHAVGIISGNYITGANEGGVNTADAGSRLSIIGNYFHLCEEFGIHTGNSSPKVINGNVFSSATPELDFDVTPDPTWTIKDNYNFRGELVDPTFTKTLATIAKNATSTTALHNIPYPPEKEDVRITPLENIEPASNWWVSGVTETNITIVVDAPPNRDALFCVEVDVRN